MKYGIFILVLVMAASGIALASSDTAYKTVLLVPQGIDGRPGSWPAMDPICTNILAANGYTVLRGVPAEQALAIAGLKLTNGTKGNPVPSVVGKDNLDSLQKAREAAGVDLVAAIAFRNRSNWVPLKGGTRGWSAVDLVMVDKDGVAFLVHVPEVYKGASNFEIGGRLVTAGIGTSMAAGRAWASWVPSHWNWGRLGPRYFGWGVLTAATFIPGRSRCHREQKAMEKNASVAFSLFFEAIKNPAVADQTAKVEILSNQPVATTTIEPTPQATLPDLPKVVGQVGSLPSLPDLPLAPTV